jgi:serine/threonine-protein kinase PknG
MKCAQPGCTGDIEEDGFCNQCGMAPEIGAALEPSPLSAATAAPRRPETSPRTGTRRSGTTRAARTAAGTGTGGRAGRVVVPPPDIKAEADVVLENPSIPESKRFCGKCNGPVGRGRNGRPGLTEGFCPSCQQRFSFSPKLAPSDVVGNQYEVAGCIAHGGLGWIYLARDHKVGQRWVVLKGLLRDDDFDVIRGELQFLATVDHPNIVKVHNFVEHENEPYIVMEYVRGSTLRKMLEERRAANNGEPDPLPLAHAIMFVLGVLPAFAYLHRQGLLFCDFKPDNVIQTDSTVKLIDLGAVYRMDDTASAIYGTPGYQAPEIGDTGPTIPSDLYTVGRTLAVLCTDARGYQSTYSRSLPTPNDVPLFAEHDSLYRFLLRACAADPDDRFQSADEMADQLNGVLHEIVASESGDPWPEPSATFTGELRSNRDDPSDWRALPAPLLAADDPAAAFLASLGVATTEPDEILTLLEQAPERTVEVQLREARTLIEAGRHDDADGVLNEIALADPWEWRVAWTTGLNALAQSQHDRALREFRGVYASSLPGELAPKLAMAYAAECGGDLAQAAHWYDIVSTTDPGFTSAVFGLARCRIRRGDVDAAIRAYERVPSSSSAYVDAQVAKTEAMLDADARALTVDDVVAAGAVVDGLNLPKEVHARLSAAVLTAALALVEHMNGAAPAAAAGPTVLGCPFTEPGIRAGLESTYRRLALQAPIGAERIALVDRANELRPRTLV